MFDMLIKGGTVVSSRAQKRLNILVSGGKIAGLRDPADKLPEAETTVDASGCFIFPGIIDGHTHFHLKLSTGYTSDDFTSGSKAALCGGITTFLDYTTQPAGESIAGALYKRLEDAEGKSYADFGFHGQVMGWNRIKDNREDMRRAFEEGMTSFKMFTAYSARGMQSGDDEFYQALETARDIGALVCVHAENGEITDLLTERYAPGGGPAALIKARPDFTEAESVSRIIRIASAAGAPVYFVHLSTAAAAEEVAEARAKGLRVIGETCPQYLVLTNELLKKTDGELYTCCPPLRAEGNGIGLWRRVAEGDIKTFGSDNCTCDRKMKEAGNKDIRNIPMGFAGSQTLMPAVYTYGVKEGLISPNRLVEMFCENPARIMGIPGKGFIQTGYDADFAVVDPEKEVKVDCGELEHNTDYSVWQGHEMYGFPKYTILRGKIMVKNWKFAAEKPEGLFIKRKKPEIL